MAKFAICFVWYITKIFNPLAAMHIFKASQVKYVRFSTSLGSFRQQAKQDAFAMRGQIIYYKSEV